MADKPDRPARANPILGVGRRAGLMAGVAGLSAVAGVSAAKALRQHKLIEDAYEGEDFALLEADRGCVVMTPDGTPLVVREVGADGGVRTWFLSAHGIVSLPACRFGAALGR
jgi:hypothetical protein